MRPGGIMLRALELTGRERPRVLLVLTASGDDHQYLSTMYSALSNASCDVDRSSWLDTFTYTAACLPDHDDDDDDEEDDEALTFRCTCHA